MSALDLVMTNIRSLVINNTSTHLVWLPVAKMSMVQNIINWQTFIFSEVLNHHCNLDLEDKKIHILVIIWLMMIMHHHTKFDYKSLNHSEV